MSGARADGNGMGEDFAKEDSDKKESRECKGNNWSSYLVNKWRDLSVFKLKIILNFSFGSSMLWNILIRQIVSIVGIKIGVSVQIKWTEDLQQVGAN